jgi:hypothetical protein
MQSKKSNKIINKLKFKMKGSIRHLNKEWRTFKKLNKKWKIKLASHQII